MLTLFVTTQTTSSELRFDEDSSIDSVKNRLELITGISPVDMELQLFDERDISKGILANGTLASNGVKNLMRVHVNVLNGAISSNTNINYFNNVDMSTVPKYEMSQEEYEKRTDSVFAWKQRMMKQEASSACGNCQCEDREESTECKIGDRIRVNSEDGLSKKGTVKFIGTVNFAKGTYIGVEYDEPLGKHNGTVNGVEYFVARQKCGAFVKPNLISVLEGNDALEDEIEF